MILLFINLFILEKQFLQMCEFLVHLIFFLISVVGPLSLYHSYTGICILCILQWQANL
jgi:hypothetical protein